MRISPAISRGCSFSVTISVTVVMLLSSGCGDSSAGRVDDSLMMSPGASGAQLALPGVDSSGIRVISVSRDSMLALPQWTLEASQPVIGTGRTEPEYLLNRPGLPWRLSDGRIIVSTDVTGFRIYATNGAHLRSIGQFGQGPEDYQQIGNVRADAHDSLLIIDGAFQRVNVYTDSGKFVRQFSVKSLGIGPFGPKWIGSSKLVVGLTPANASLSAPQPTITRDTLYVVLRNADGSNVDTVSRIPRSWSRRTPTGRASVPLTGSPQLGAGMRSFATSEPESFSLKWYDDSGRLVRIIRDPNFLNPIHPDSSAAFERRQASGSDYPPVPLSQYPTHGPVVTALVIDRTERLWVRLWAPSTERIPTWIIFDPEGRPTARVQMPSTTLFADAGADYLLVRELDEMDVASVRMYTIRGTAR